MNNVNRTTPIKRNKTKSVLTIPDRFSFRRENLSTVEM